MKLLQCQQVRPEPEFDFSRSEKSSWPGLSSHICKEADRYHISKQGITRKRNFICNSCVVWIPNKLKTFHRLLLTKLKGEIFSIDRFCSPSQMTTMSLPWPLFAENTKQHLYLSKETKINFLLMQWPCPEFDPLKVDWPSPHTKPRCSTFQIINQKPLLKLREVGKIHPCVICCISQSLLVVEHNNSANIKTSRCCRCCSPLLGL